MRRLLRGGLLACVLHSLLLLLSFSSFSASRGAAAVLSGLCGGDSVRGVSAMGDALGRGVFPEGVAGRDSVGRHDSIPVRSANVLGRLGVADTIHRIAVWHQRPAGWSYRPGGVDSSLDISHYVHIGEPVRSTVRQMGIHYSPQRADDYFVRERMGRDVPFWMEAQLVHARQPRRVYHTLGPFACFSAVSNGSSSVPDLGAGLLYTQNVTQHVNLGFDVQHGSERSVYRHLEGSVSKGQAFASVSRGRWFAAVWGGGGRHSLKHNGGIADDRLLTDTVLREVEIPVLLSEAASMIRTQDFSVDLAFDAMQRVRDEVDTFGKVLSTYREPLLSIVSQHSYLHYSRSYTDRTPSGSGVSVRNISTLITHDSVAFSLYEGRLGVSYRGGWEQGRCGIYEARAWGDYSHRAYTMPSVRLYLQPAGGYRHSHSVGVGGEVHGYLRSVDTRLVGWVALGGGERGASRLSAEAQYRFRGILGGVCLRGESEFVVTPVQPFVRQFYSNGHAWSLGDWGASRELRLRMVANLPGVGGAYGVQLASHGNYVYFDSLSRPAQSLRLEVVGLYADQRISYGGFLLHARGVYQFSSREGAIALPRVVAFGQLGYEYAWPMGGLRLRLAVEVNYHTAYHADVYDDGLGAYRRQESVLVGNYPLLGALLGLKWKSANVFVHLTHANEGLMGRHFFSGIHYPERERTFRFGFQWYFY